MPLLSEEDAKIETAAARAREPLASWPRMVSAMLTAALLLAALPGLRQANAASPDLASAPGVLTDPLSARALFGFDPVAYFIDGRPRAGQHSIVYRWRGADWHFVNQENLERFRAAPELFAPQLSGHDPLRAIAGFTAAADPTLFLVSHGRLWLFRDPASRAAFLDDPAIADTALAAWAEIDKNDLVQDLLSVR